MAHVQAPAPTKGISIFKGLSVLRANEKTVKELTEEQKKRQEYLRKYTAGAADSKERVKKVKKRKKPAEASSHKIVIVDEDLTGFVDPGKAALDEEEEEDRPVLENEAEAAVLLRQTEEAKNYYRKKQDGRGWAALSDGSRSPPRRSTQHPAPTATGDLSPPRARPRPDQSPPRRRHKPDTDHITEDVSPHRRSQKVGPPGSPTWSPPRRRQAGQDLGVSPPSRRPMASSADVEADPSPPRRRQRKDEQIEDVSPPRRRPARQEEDVSPPRRQPARQEEDVSPPRRRPGTQEEDASPPRRRPARQEEDASPPRRRPGTQEEDASPPRRWPGRQVEDASPPRRRPGRHEEDVSPPRRRPGRQEEDASPPRRRPSRQEEDVSPLRRVAIKQEDASPPRRRPARQDENTVSPPRRGSVKQEAAAPPVFKEGDGTGFNKTGLVSREELRVEMKKVQEEQERRRRAAAAAATTETVFRDRQTGQITKRQADPVVTEPEDPREKKIKERKARELEEQQIAKETYRALKQAMAPAPKKEEDIDTELKGRLRWGDPMAHLVKSGGASAAGDDAVMMPQAVPTVPGGFPIPQEIPAHSWIRRKLPYPPNRYGIRPGKHWDGVNRSNGFEEELFKKRNQRDVWDEEAYMWGVADM